MFALVMTFVPTPQPGAAQQASVEDKAREDSIAEKARVIDSLHLQIKVNNDLLERRGLLHDSTNTTPQNNAQ